MKIIYRFSKHFSADDVSFMKNNGYNVNSGFDVVLIPKEDSNFLKIKDRFGDDGLAMPEITYTKKELESASFLKIYAKKYLGYAKPDDEDEVDDFEYPFDIYPYYKGVFEIAKTDPEYGVLRGRQIGNYQMKGKPKWGTSQIASLWGAEDSFFTTPEVYQEVFKPLGIQSIPVINYSNKEIQTEIVQILQQGVSKSKLNITNHHIKEAITVQNFGITKYVMDGGVPPPAFVDSPRDMDFFYTQEYFGSGGFTQRSTIISNKLYNILQEKKIKGLNYAPLMKSSSSESIFLSEKEEGSGTRTFRGKTYTQEEWEAFEKQQWEKYKGK
ncbi:MAG: hypothetical protein ACK5IC_07605 [Moheibacter sp.]